MDRCIISVTLTQLHSDPIYICMYVVCKQKVNDMSRHVKEMHDLDSLERVLVIFNFSLVSLLC